MIFSFREWLSISLLLVIPLAVALPGIYYFNYGFVPDFWLAESGVYESVGAAACLVAGLIGLASFRLLLQKKALGAVWMLLFSVGCLLIAGEEVSWGQHAFKYDLPATVTENNFQGELNLHNSKLFQASNNEFAKAFTRLLMLYFIVVPMILIILPSLGGLFKRVMLPVPSLVVSLVLLLATWCNIFNHKVIYGQSFTVDNLRLGEALESTLEICLLILAIEYFFHTKNKLMKAI